jgi:hypothetical protein
MKPKAEDLCFTFCESPGLMPSEFIGIIQGAEAPCSLQRQCRKFFRSL